MITRKSTLMMSKKCESPRKLYSPVVKKKNKWQKRILHAMQLQQDPNLLGWKNGLLTVLTKTNSLKLKLYRSLGVELEGDGEYGFKRALIRSSPRAEAKIIDIDSRFSKNYYVNQFWQAM